MTQTFTSPNQRPRKGDISILVIHYTEIDWPATKRAFLNPKAEVSSHLVIDQDGTVYRFVEDDCVAYHAGKSTWYDLEGINEYSIGIELVHPGISKNKGIKVQGDPQLWVPYDDRQIDKLIEICHEYIKKYDISPHNIVGHSDIAAWRYNTSGNIYAAKQDPGPLFPWKRLYDAGIGRWPPVRSFSRKRESIGGDLTTMDPRFREDDHLKELGYHITDNSLSLKLTTRAFQMHYRSRNIDGIIDEETEKIILNFN